MKKVEVTLKLSVVVDNDYSVSEHTNDILQDAKKAFPTLQVEVLAFNGFGLDQTGEVASMAIQTFG